MSATQRASYQQNSAYKSPSEVEQAMKKCHPIPRTRRSPK